MRIPRRLLSPLHHCEDAAVKLSKYLNIRVTQSSLRRDLLEHPNYPSLTALMDVFSNFGVDNEAYKLSIENFDQLPVPFLLHIKADKLQHDLFAPVFKVHSDWIELYNPETKRNEVWKNERLQTMYKGTVLALEANQHSGEIEYEKKLKKEKERSVILSLILIIPLLLTLTYCTISIIKHPGTPVIAPVIFTILTFIGCIITALLLWHQIDEYNPALKQICQSGKKVNCSAILNSKAAKIFGVSWSSIGFTYFMGMLLALLTSGSTNLPVLELLSWVNILALPYIFFSVYYQWRVAKQWCMLCLLVQGALFLQFVTVITAGLPALIPLKAIGPQTYATVFSCFAIVFAVTLLFMPVLEQATQSEHATIELQRLKHNPQIFNALLSKERSLARSTDGLGITLGNSRAKYKLVKVCNPYCGPCAKAHPVLEELLENNSDIQLQIIFTATGRENDYQAPIVKHLLAIDNKEDEAFTKKALDDWYTSEKKDYAAFAAKYADPLDLESQGKAIKAMHEWCTAIDIAFTPTFFINGRQLPEIYSVKDLKYFFSV